MAGTGADHAAVMDPFRARVLGAIRALRADTVVVTHFLAINAVVGAATADDRVVCFTPTHCSRTIVELDDDGGSTWSSSVTRAPPTSASDGTSPSPSASAVLRSRGRNR